MSTKEWILVAFVLVLGGLWVVFFSGWFRPKIMRIEHSVRSVRAATGRGQQALGNVTFALHQKYRLTSVQVVRADEVQTNQFAHALWHLVSKQGSEAVDGLCYGLPVNGMIPAISTSEIEPLEPGIAYRLLVETTSIKAEHDFTVPPTATVK